MLAGDYSELGKVIDMFAKLHKSMNDLAALSPRTKKEEKELRERLNYKLNYCVRDIHFTENLPEILRENKTNETLACSYTCISDIAVNTEG